MQLACPAAYYRGMTLPAPAFAKYLHALRPRAAADGPLLHRLRPPVRGSRSPPLEVAHELTPESAYPIRYHVRDDLRRSRALAVFRLVIAVPHLIGWILAVPMSTVVAVISWPIALVAGRVPAPFHRLQAALLAYVTRIAAYLCLATDEWPPFPWQTAPEYPIQVEVDSAASFSRLAALVVLPRPCPPRSRP